ncbi:MAG: MBL fold metallo-hydrolase [Acidobacteriota bacterium]|nr:MBL fold metallo-hydrolase [Acidobacteriota bacterium]
MLPDMERRPAQPGPATCPEPRESAVAIVVRRREGAWEVLVGLRSRRSRFLPGNWAFLGGRLESIDASGPGDAHLRCAARELEEETGLALEEASWFDAGMLITPPLYPLRYRTRFFLACAPEDWRPPRTPPIPEEIEALRMVGARELLAEWRRGRVIVPPILPPLLEVLACGGDDDPARLAENVARACRRQEACHRIEFVPGVWCYPLESRTLPPATHTNAWMPGATRFVLIDPGSDDPAQLARLENVVQRRRADGATLAAVVLTHHHPDHAGGAAWAAERWGRGVWAHPSTLERIDLPRWMPTRSLADGEGIDLGGVDLRVIATPGHAPGHLVFHCPARSAVICGDLVSSLSTILIDPADGGDMARYLESLVRVAALAPRWLFPAHGPPLPGRALEGFQRHRLERERLVERALQAAPRSLREVADAAYRDAPPGRVEPDRAPGARPPPASRGPRSRSAVRRRVAAW